MAKKNNGQLFKLLFENLLDGFAHCHAIFDSDGALVDWEYALVNPAFETLTGLGDVTGKKVSKVIPNLLTANPHLFLAYGRVAKGGERERFEEYLSPLDMWFDVSVFCVDKGTFTVVFQNITKQKNAMRELSNANDQTITAWANALAWRNRETSDHTVRVCVLAVKFAEAIGMTNEALMNIRRGALLHDIGKIGIPDRILLKETSLTSDEFAEMKYHSQYAYDVLNAVEYLRPAIDIPYSHHERWDGSGYPQGLAGKEIPLAARLFAIVDVYDALRSDRPYRKSMPKGVVLDHIRKMSGKDFDPMLVDVFMMMMDHQHQEDDYG